VFVLSAPTLGILDSYHRPFLFPAGCEPNASDYFYYVLDNFSVLDFIQSFGIDLWKCSLQRGLIVGTISLVLKLYTSYVVGFTFIYFWERWTPKVESAVG
jgi:hypothetical protein